MDKVEPLFQRRCFWTWVIGVPFAIPSSPVDLPDIAASHIAGLCHRALDPLRIVPEIRPPLEDLNLLSLDALAFPDLVAEMKRGTTMRPEYPFDLFGVCGDFVLGKCHGSPSNPSGRSVKLFGRDQFY